jgi:fructokinase
MFLVCGEALVDVYEANHTSTGVNLESHVGGSPFNVALCLARLGQPVSFMGSVSNDFLGERIMRALQSAGVGSERVVRSALPTTLSLVGLDAHGVPAYQFYGEAGADRQLLKESLAATPLSARAFHFGSFSTVVEPIASTLRELVGREYTRNVISYDPNVRLNVVLDVERWRAQLCWMLPRTHLLKISEEDLSILFPDDEVELLAARWQAQGVRLIVVTRGAQGVRAWCGAGSVSLAAEKVNVIDTVGAGDTFQAALLAWLAENHKMSIEGLVELDTKQLRAALVFATRAATITCSRRGAYSPLRSEVSDL